jgi:integrase
VRAWREPASTGKISGKLRSQPDCEANDATETIEGMGEMSALGWHTFRHSFGPLMNANGEDVKTIQELLRHANFKVTMDVDTQAVTDVKRTAHSRVARQIVGTKKEEEDEA